jgi:phytoene synthase
MSSPPQRPSATAEENLAAAIGADRALMLQQVSAELRPAFEALWALDAAMGDVVARSTQPALGAIKLAWWRQRLQELDTAAAPAEPRLRAAAEHLLPRGVGGADLAALEPGWATLLDEQVDPSLVADRGAALFRLGARLLGTEDEMIDDAGALYALVSVARRGVPQLLSEAAAPVGRLRGHRFARPLRVLTALSRLAARDLKSAPAFEPEGAPSRLAAMLRHRWSGVVTRAY